MSRNHNIMNLGNQNSKYSWRIRDLKNPETGTQFANSVLMYKIILSTAHSFQLYRFSVVCRFPFPILLFFTVKSPSVTQRSVSQENAYKKS